jgi:hypothetical protein
MNEMLRNGKKRGVLGGEGRGLKRRGKGRRKRRI